MNYEATSVCPRCLKEHDLLTMEMKELPNYKEGDIRFYYICPETQHPFFVRKIDTVTEIERKPYGDPTEEKMDVHFLFTGGWAVIPFPTNKRKEVEDGLDRLLRWKLTMHIHGGVKEYGNIPIETHMDFYGFKFFSTHLIGYYIAEQTKEPEYEVRKKYMKEALRMMQREHPKEPWEDDDETE